MGALRKARGSQLLGSISVMRSTAHPSSKAGHVSSLSGHAARITDRRTLSWSSGATHPLGGTSWFPPSLRRSTASKGRFLIPLVVHELAQLNHPYTSTTRGRASSPKGSGTVPQSRSQGRAPPVPRAGSPCGPCACGAGAASRPPPRRGHLRRSCLSPGAHGALVLAYGSLAGPHASVPLSVPWVSPPVPHALACTAGAGALLVPMPMPLAAPALTRLPSLRSMRPVAARLGALLAPLRALPMPWPLPGVASSAARALSPPCCCWPRRPVRVYALAPCRVCPVASCPPPRAPVAGTLPCLRAVPPFLDNAPGVPLPLQLRQRDARRGTLGCRGADVPRPHGRKGFGGNGFGGLVWVLVGLVAARYFAPSLPTAAAAAAAGEAPVARAGSVSSSCGVLGPAAWPAEAVAPLARAAVATPRAPSPPPSACRRGPRSGLRRGLLWLRSHPRCSSGVPPRGWAAGLAAWAAGAVTSAGSGSRVNGPVSAEAGARGGAGGGTRGGARGCPAGGPTGTAASASLRSSRSARVSPA